VLKVGQLPAAYELAASKYRDIALAEQFVDGPEYTASIVDDAPLPLIRIAAPKGNYDYQNKYFTDDTKYHCPAGLAAAKEKALQALALRAFQLIGCKGWGRVDLMLTKTGKAYLLEVNTAPGMTGHSLVPMAARARWGADALVNAYGERFAGSAQTELPMLSGPAVSEAEVTRRYLRFVELVRPLGSPIEGVSLSARHAWQVRLANGIELKLGRDGDAAERRLARFIDAYAGSARAAAGALIDLRYPNGFALRVKG